MAALLLSICAAIPSDLVVRDHYDVVELNYFYDERARLIFRQVIWWDYMHWEGAYRCQDWRLVKCDGVLPQRRNAQDDWISHWRDPKSRCWRIVTARHCRLTHTQFDPELVDRDYLARERRRGLTRPPRK